MIIHETLKHSKVLRQSGLESSQQISINKTVSKFAFNFLKQYNGKKWTFLKSTVTCDEMWNRNYKPKNKRWPNIELKRMRFKVKKEKIKNTSFSKKSRNDFVLILRLKKNSLVEYYLKKGVTILNSEKIYINILKPAI